MRWIYDRTIPHGGRWTPDFDNGKDLHRNRMERHTNIRKFKVINHRTGCTADQY